MADSHHTLDIGGKTVPLRVRRNKRARQLILRVDERGGAVVTIPPRTAVREAVDMARRQSDWLAEQLALYPDPVPFEDGAHVPYLDEPHVIRHAPEGRGVTRAAGEIRVAGRVEHLPRRLTDWLKTRARAEIQPRLDGYVARVDKLSPATAPHKVARLTLRDTRSRWGSCGPNGLNFCWRLIFAPAYVLDYVVAHEAAHLAHHNHGPAFWALADRLTPHHAEAKAWLNTHGRGLHRFGGPPA